MNQKKEFIVATERGNRTMMMHDILVKAFKNGFRWQYISSALPADVKVEISGGDRKIRFTHKDISGPGGGWYTDFYTVFFSHDFAQAFFGDEWQQKLRELVLEESPLEYLYERIEDKDGEKI
jgi:hypothetical protein